MKKILVIGSMNLDMTVSVDHMPKTGETILSKSIKYAAGGKGANQACAAAKLGAAVSMIGAVGRDSGADVLIRSLSEAGVDLTGVIVNENSPTGMALIPVNKNGDNCIIVVQGANAAISVKNIDDNSSLIKNCDIVLLQMEIPVETVCYAAKLAKQLGKTVILDPAPVPDKFPDELYKYIDVIKPNETELGMLTGNRNVMENLSEVTGLIRSKGVKNVLVSLGGDGAFLDSETEGKICFPAHKVHVVDTTAAGDSFTAAFATKMLESGSLKEAAEFAGCVSALTVTRMGAQTSLPNLEEVEEFISTL